jgi:hypothetical protein
VQALQAGTYTVKPASSSVFVPFKVVVNAHAVTNSDAMAGKLDFRWPGDDCWSVFRGEEKAVGSCGSHVQALQAGTYTVKPASSPVFKPFNIRVKRGETVTAP